MSPRKPKNIVDDIASFTSSWLGGAPKGEATALTKGKGAVKEILGGLDSGFTGGVGRAVLKDAQAGPNAVPVNLLKVGAQNVAAAAVGAGLAKVAGKVVGSVLANKGNLSKGEDLVLHFSNNPNLKKIIDIPSLRNQGANFGGPFNSTNFSPPGSTYGYGPIQNTGAVQETGAAFKEAISSNMAAALKGETREYTLYATKANPLKSSKSAIKDPEYGKEILSGYSNENIFGKQKVISSVPMNIQPYVDAQKTINAARAKTSAYDSKTLDALREQEMNLASKAQDAIYNALASNKKVVQAGMNPSKYQNPFGIGVGDPPILRTQPTSSGKQNYVSSAVGAYVGFVAPKKGRGGNGTKKK